MAKDTLKQLDVSIDGMFFTGAQVARLNPELGTSKTKLAPIAAKIPAIRRVTEQVGKLEQAEGKSAASELLDLALLLAQVRSAQASPQLPAETGEWTDLPPAAKIGSPLLPAELQALVGALTNTGESKQRAAMIGDAVFRGSAKDLRILSLCVPALSDSHIADVVETRLIPAMGQAVIPELRKALDIEKGRTIDQRILRSIVRIEGVDAMDILNDSIARGSADIRSAAIEEFGRVAPDAAEPIATMLVEKDRSKEVKISAIRALAKAQGDAALDVLIRSFGGSAEMRAAAEASLIQSTHRHATEKIIALFTPEFADLAHYKIKKATTKEEKDEAAKAQKAHNEKIGYLVDLVDLLSARGTEATKAIVVQIFRTHKIKEVRDTAARALLRMGYQEAWDELVPALYEAPEAAQYQFIHGAFAFEPSKAYERLAPFFKSEALVNKSGLEFAQRVMLRLTAIFDEPGNEHLVALFEPNSPWSELAIQLIPVEALRTYALSLLKRTKSAKALEPALNLVRDPLPNAHVPMVIEFLTQYRDTRVPAALIRLFNMLQGQYHYAHACDLFKRYDEPTLGAMLRYWLEERKMKRKMSKTEVEPIENCIRFLQRDRTSPPPTDN
jgi:HEAT repeat protein